MILQFLYKINQTLFILIMRQTFMHRLFVFLGIVVTYIAFVLIIEYIITSSAPYKDEWHPFYRITYVIEGIICATLFYLSTIPRADLLQLLELMGYIIAIGFILFYNDPPPMRKWQSRGDFDETTLWQGQERVLHRGN